MTPLWFIYYNTRNFIPNYSLTLTNPNPLCRSASLKYDTCMLYFLIFGFIGFIELLIVFSLIHYLMSRKNLRQNIRLVPLFALLCSFGYAFQIFIIEKEGQSSLGGSIADGIRIYLFIFSFFSIGFAIAFVTLKKLLDTRQQSKK